MLQKAQDKKGSTYEQDVHKCQIDSTTRDLKLLLDHLNNIEQELRLLEYERRDMLNKLEQMRNQCQHKYEVVEHLRGSHGTDTWWKCIYCEQSR